MTEASDQWHFGDRYYVLTLASTPTSMDVELEEVGSSRERREGPLLVASCDDVSQEVTLSVWTDQPLPVDLIEQFLAEARRLLPRRA